MSVNNQFALQPITILERYVDFGITTEERIPAFLTSANHAMYVDQKVGILFILGVEPTNEPSVYTANTAFTELGRIEDPARETEVIGALCTILKGMTAYEFIAKVILHVEQEVDYAGLIVPNLIMEAN